MKKKMTSYLLLSLTLLAVVSLVACGKQEQTSQKTSESSSSSQSSQDNQDKGQKAYQVVLDRYSRYMPGLTRRDKESLMEELKQIDPSSEENGFILAMSDYEPAPSLRYSFRDLDKNGQVELLIGNKDNLLAVYYLKDKTPQILHAGYNTAAGGFRSNLTAYDNGQIVYAVWQSVQPDMSLTLYGFEDAGATVVKEASKKVQGEESMEQALGLTASKADLASFDWKDFEAASSATSSSQQTTEANQKFQVRVSVADLRIRKEASTQAQEMGMIARGVHTITETKTADGYTWGRLESGQGWIALEFTSRVEETSAASSSTSSMNLDEIASGNFASLAGTWQNGKGSSMSFDANGLVTVNGQNVAGKEIIQNFKLDNGSVFAGVYYTESKVGGYELGFIPAGAPLPKQLQYTTDTVDTSRDIIYAGQSPVADSSELYYRLP